MAKRTEDTPKKSWSESDERKKLLEGIADEEERKAADEWDKTDAQKARIKRAREEYEKTSSNGAEPKKRSGWLDRD
jgi:hypothetical protein